MNGKKCKECGKPLLGKQRKFCSTACSNRNYRKRCVKENVPQLPPIKCAYCGTEFIPKGQNAKFCKPYCCTKYHRTKESGNLDPDRELTSSTPYLIQKWHAEGMAVTELIKITRRSEARIKEALSVRLSAQDYRTMREYFNPKNKTKHKCV